MNQTNRKLKEAVQEAISATIRPDKKVIDLHILGLSKTNTLLLEKELRAPYLDTIDITISYRDEHDEDEELVGSTLHVGLDIFSHRTKEIQDFDNLFKRVKEIIFNYVETEVTLDFHMSRNS